MEGSSKLKAKKPAEVEPGHIKGVLFGKSGAGKTWFALNFPAPYYIDTEGGANRKHYQAKLEASGGAYLGQEDGACDFGEVLDQVKALSTEKHGYKTLVIDSITKIFQSAIAKEAERLGSKDAYGASKKPAVAEMRKLINWIMRLDMNVWFIAHEVAEWQSVGGERKEVGRAPDAWEKLVYELDLALRIEHPGSDIRVATVTKSRLIGFPEFDRLTLQDGDKDYGYAEFAKRYGKDFIEAEAKPIQLVTAESLAEIQRLIGVLKIDEAELEKVLKKAKVDSYDEMTEDQAKIFITFMKGKVNA